MSFLVSRPIRSLTAVAAVLSLLPGLIAAGAQSAAAPSLRLVSSQHEMTLKRTRGRVYLNLGVFFAATGDNFEVHVARPDYESPFEAGQVDPITKSVLRTIPVDSLDFSGGLQDFTRVTFRDAEGDVIAKQKMSFCPNSYERQRLNDDGPDLSTYPSWCDLTSPFTKGMVWGIDEGWASPAFYDYSHAVDVPNGEYDVTVRIPGRYVDLFEIPAEDSKVVLDVTVTGRTRGHHAHPAAARAGSGTQAVPTQGVPIDTNPDPDTVPDLVALPTWSMRARHSGGNDYLGFAVTPWNAGPAPMVVEGFRRPNEDVMDAFQYFYDESEDAVGRAPVGTMEFDRRRGHHHWHFLQFAEFTLVDPSDQEVVRSKKQSFCLAPTDAIDLTVPRAAYDAFTGGRFTQCGGEGAIWVREVLAAGWGDTYYQSVGGQSFNITNVPNGWYSVRVAVNPTGELFEASLDNNVETRLVHLGGHPGARKVLMAPWHGITE
jgi:hypothetical protein